MIKTKPQVRLTSIFLILLPFAGITLLIQCNRQAKKEYEPTWESLASHPTPEWYRDAKFGIFIHWGVYSVPAYHEWYVTFMSPKSAFGHNLGGPPYTAAQGDLPDSTFIANIREDANQYHRENFGVDFAYDDFIPMFKAEHFDPGAWADLFRKSGARYVVLTAKHGEEFALWPTEYTPRNAMEMGPHRDLVGELTNEVRSRGMKMGLYHNTTYSFWDERYPEKEWIEYMHNSIKELVDKYHPDILWGDVIGVPIRDEKDRPLGADYWKSKEVIAYFYNHSPNPDEVVANDRWGLDTSAAGIQSEKALAHSLHAHRAKGWNIEEAALLGDFQTPERRRVNKIYHIPWETCDALDPTSWGFNKRLPEEDYMTTNELVDYLADVVSKGGNLLINIGPRADGTIPQVMQERLTGAGEWLSVNGEAIYGTRPWVIYGEGPSVEEVDLEGTKGRYETADVRFTRKGDVLYAILLEWPGSELYLNSLEGITINKVSMLGSTKEIRWQKLDQGIHISLTSDPVSPHANVLKLECERLSR